LGQHLTAASLSPSLLKRFFPEGSSEENGAVVTLYAKGDASAESFRPASFRYLKPIADATEPRQRVIKLRPLTTRKRRSPPARTPETAPAGANKVAAQKQKAVAKRPKPARRARPKKAAVVRTKKTEAKRRPSRGRALARSAKPARSRPSRRTRR